MLRLNHADCLINGLVVSGGPASGYLGGGRLDHENDALDVSGDPVECPRERRFRLNAPPQSAYIFGLLIKAFRAYLKDERPLRYKIQTNEEFPTL